MAARLNAKLDVQRVLDIVCQEAVRVLQVSAASVSLYEEQDGSFGLGRSCGLPEETMRLLQPLVHVVCARQPDHRGPLIIPDVREHPDLRGWCQPGNLNVRTLICVRLVYEQRQVGTLWALTLGQMRQITDDDAAFVRAIADQAAQAITNSLLHEALRREERNRADLLRGLITAQEDERARLARELHDETGQALSALIMGLDTVDMAMAAGSSEVSHYLRTTKTIAERLLEDTRRLIGDLRPSLLDDLGLVPAIAWYGEQRLKPLGIGLDVRCSLEETRLPSTVQTALFRIVQEAISNIAKHSKATRASVRLQVTGSDVILRVEDNGCGFEVAGFVGAGGKGLGLRGIRERATMSGGRFTLTTAPGCGTAIEVRVPLGNEEAKSGHDSCSVG